MDLSGYDTTYAEFGAYFEHRDARRLGKLYPVLMDDLPRRVEVFREFLRSQGLDDELTWRSYTEIELWMFQHAPGHGSPRPIPNPAYASGGDYLVDLEPEWAALAVDWGLFTGEAYRAEYPSLYWIPGSGERWEGPRLLPWMVGIPGSTLFDGYGAVAHMLGRLGSAVKRGRSIIKARGGLEAASTWPSKDYIEMYGKAPWVADDVEERLRKRPQDQLKVGRRLPPQRLVGKHYATGRWRSVEPLEALYGMCEHDLIGEPMTAIVTALDPENPTRDTRSRAERDETLAEFVRDLFAAWPQPSLDSGILAPWVGDEAVTVDEQAPIAQIRMGAAAPRLLVEYLSESARQRRLIVYLDAPSRPSRRQEFAAPDIVADGVPGDLSEVSYADFQEDLLGNHLDLVVIAADSQDAAREVWREWDDAHVRPLGEGEDRVLVEHNEDLARYVRELAKAWPDPMPDADYGTPWAQGEPDYDGGLVVDVSLTPLAPHQLFDDLIARAVRRGLWVYMTDGDAFLTE